MNSPARLSFEKLLRLSFLPQRLPSGYHDTSLTLNSFDTAKIGSVDGRCRWCRTGGGEFEYPASNACAGEDQVRVWEGTQRSEALSSLAHFGPSNNAGDATSVVSGCGARGSDFGGGSGSKPHAANVTTIQFQNCNGTPAHRYTKDASRRFGMASF